ncbi:gfo/Idh/MocA family oxidoreductase [Halalkalibacillus sediminis]|uniref:Gfo/Idh/MocA family oxidoreductase n=1 Tax=Halalkalibacillus sediminis TaxID=2018042 RepID=A0A2I0QVR2_9BACI|nr:Gfo/Idh/MocA family oxidoreductase [Halalkalibacillus sediminis]PKR78427.1 gfo/Idh/MocA family oxidoreductase [Halalkalibacillus sediminis]
MEKIYRIGIIGLGVVGERLLKQFQEHPRMKVVAYCEPNAERMDEIINTYGQATKYADFQKLNRDPEVDVVYVAVPPKFHHEITLDAIENGKHILCEKPLANSEEEAKEMYEKAEAANIVNAINFPLPYQPQLSQMRKVIDQGELGEIQRVEFQMYFPRWPRAWQQNNWIASREQGGFIREIAPHYLHFVSRLLGMPDHVQSFVDYPSDSTLCENGFISKMKVNGIPFLINGLSNVGQKEHLSLKVFGDKSVLELRNWRELFIETEEGDQRQIEVDVEHPNSLIQELELALAQKEHQLVTFKEGYFIQQLLEKILKG